MRKSRIEIYKLKKENENLKKQLKTKEEGISRQDSVCTKIIERGQNGYGLKLEARIFVESVLQGIKAGLFVKQTFFRMFNRYHRGGQ